MDATMGMTRSKRQLPPPDLIDRLPDDVLGAIVTLLPSAEGARTQLISRRWRPLWRSAPLNVEAGTFTAATAILASHRGGPCRRLSFNWYNSYWDFPDTTDEVLRLPGLDGLQEFELCYSADTMSSAVLFNVPRFSPTLRILSVCCRSNRSNTQLEFPAAEAAAAALVFPHLEQLTLKGVIIPESTLHGILSGCHALQSLVLHRNTGYSHLRIRSRTLRSLGISSFHGEVVIEDAPLLERLFQGCAVYRQKIKVIQAPKLKMLGYLPAADSISHEFVPPNLIFEKMELVSLPNAMRTVKILALEDVAPDNLDVVIDFLTWFPCVEKLYMALLGHSKLGNVHGKSDGVKPFESLECLDEHLKILELKGYRGLMLEVSLVRFFLKNARVLESVKFLVPRKTCYKKWISIQRRKLRRLGTRFFFKPEPYQPSSCVPIKHVHNLAMDDPFDEDDDDD